MPAAQNLSQQMPVSIQTVLDQIIIQHVELHEVIRDIDLTRDVLTEISGRKDIKSTGAGAVSAIAQSIHRLIHTGRIFGIDCDTPFGSFTLCLPAGTKARIALPVYIVDSPTRH